MFVFRAVTLSYNYKLPLVRRWRSEKPAHQAGVRVCVENVPQGRAGEHGEIGEEDRLAASDPTPLFLLQHQGTHWGQWVRAHCCWPGLAAALRHEPGR